MMRFPAGWSSISMPGLLVLVLEADEPAPAAGEERCRHLREVPLDLGERLLEAPLDRLGELVAQPARARSRERSRSSRCAGELLEARLLARVLLGRERVDLSERLAPALEPRHLRAQLFRLLIGQRLRLGLLRQPPKHLLALGLQAGALDPDRGEPFRRLGRRPPQLGLLGAQAPELLAELGRAAAARVDAGAERRLEAAPPRRPPRRAPRRRARLGRRAPPGCGRARPGREQAPRFAESAANQLSPPERRSSASRPSAWAPSSRATAAASGRRLGCPRPGRGERSLVAGRLGDGDQAGLLRVRP